MTINMENKKIIFEKQLFGYFTFNLCAQKLQILFNLPTKIDLYILTKT